MPKNKSDIVIIYINNVDEINIKINFLMFCSFRSANEKIAMRKNNVTCLEYTRTYLASTSVNNDIKNGINSNKTKTAIIFWRLV